MNCISKACQDFGLTIHLGSTTSDTLSLDSMLNMYRHIGKSGPTIPSLTKRVSQKKSWRKIPRSRSTQPVIWAQCCTAVSPGLFKPDGRGRLTLSTCAEKTYTLINSDVCARLALFWEWTTADPNNLLYEELAQGNCLTGRLQLRYIQP